MIDATDFRAPNLTEIRTAQACDNCQADLQGVDDPGAGIHVSCRPPNLKFYCAACSATVRP